MHEDQRLLNMTELALTQLDVWMITDKWEIDQKIALGKWKWPICMAYLLKAKSLQMKAAHFADNSS